MVTIRKLLGIVAVLGLMAVAAAPALAAKATPATPLAPQAVSATTFTNPAGVQSFGSVQCPAGSLRTGGGVFGSAGLQQSVNSSYPSGNGWAAYMNNTASSAASFTVYAVCLS
jgi:hypothetical protein